MVKDVVDGVERIAKNEKGNYGYGNTGCGVFKPGVKIRKEIA